MFNIESLTTADLIELSKDVSFAIDMSSNEEQYTILDEIENTIALREANEELLLEVKETTVNSNSYDPGDIEMNQGWLE